MSDADAGAGRPAEPDDLELIAAWRDGDQRAAATLVARHADALARFAAVHSRDMDIEELVQDTFVRAFGAIDRFRGDSSFRTWLITIERRLILDRQRAARRTPTRELTDDSAATPFDALDDMLARETAEQLRQALSQLTPTQREVLLLRVNQGLSYRDIASVVGTTEGAARVHYHNAVRTIKERLHG